MTGVPTLLATRLPVTGVPIRLPKAGVPTWLP